MHFIIYQKINLNYYVLHQFFQQKSKQILKRRKENNRQSKVYLGKN